MVLAESRLSIGGTLGGLYAMIIVVLGVAYPIAFFLSSGIQDEGLYLPIFHIYLYSVSFIFLLYVQISIVIEKRRFAKRLRRHFDKVCTITVKVTPSPEDTPDIGHHGDQKTLTPSNSFIKTAVVEDTEDEEEEMYEIPFTQSAHGVNFYLRLGTIGFALGTMAQDCFYLIQFVDGSAKIWNCFGVPYIVMMCLRIFFTLFEAFFIFKNHRVMLKFNTGLLRLGLLHTIATNLCIWANVVVHEATEAIVHMDDHVIHSHNKTMSTTHAPFTTYALHHDTGHHGSSNHGDTHHYASRVSREVHGNSAGHTSRITTMQCLSEQTISNGTAPYLYPFTIEFSLIAAAVLYKIFTNVGSNDETIEEAAKRRRHVSQLYNIDIEEKSGECGKANTGLFLGMFMFMLTLVSTCMFMIFYSKPDTYEAHITGWIYFITDSTLNLVSLFVTILAFIKTRGLGYSKVASHFDENLVIVSLTGVYFLMAFAVIPSFTLLHMPGYTGRFAQFQVTSKTIKFLQTTTQVVFIIDGLRRHAANREQIVQKPGRSLITFLLISNLAMWVINTFQMKEITNAQGIRDYYGSLAWVVMVHMTQPLAIFFRFHSSICLSDIWVHCYKPVYQSLDDDLDEIDKVPLRETEI